MLQEDCVRRFPAIYGKAVVTDRMMCAGSSSVNSCRHDSGGLLVVRNPEGSYSLAGILGPGITCDSSGNVGIFTKIPAVNDWLVENMIE